MQQIGHQHAVSRHSHPSRTDIRMQHIRSVIRRLLSAEERLQASFFKHQRIGIAADGGHCGVGGQLVEEEHTPVVAVGHSHLAVAERELSEHLLPDVGPMPREHLALGTRFLRVLGQTEGDEALGHLLQHHVLVGCVEIVVVLQREIVVEIRSGVPLFGWSARHEGGVVGIGCHSVAVETIAQQGFVPLLGVGMLGEEGAGSGQHVRFPSVLLGLGVALEACRHGAGQLEVGLG